MSLIPGHNIPTSNAALKEPVSLRFGVDNPPCYWVSLFGWFDENLIFLAGTSLDRPKNRGNNALKVVIDKKVPNNERLQRRIYSPLVVNCRNQTRSTKHRPHLFFCGNNHRIHRSIPIISWFVHMNSFGLGCWGKSIFFQNRHTFKALALLRCSKLQPIEPSTPWAASKTTVKASQAGKGTRKNFK